MNTKTFTPKSTMKIYTCLCLLFLADYLVAQNNTSYISSGRGAIAYYFLCGFTRALVRNNISIVPTLFFTIKELGTNYNF